MHLREQHAGVSVESVIGPSPLSLGRIKKCKDAPIPSALKKSVKAKKKPGAASTFSSAEATDRSLRKKVRFKVVEQDDSEQATSKEEEVQLEEESERMEVEDGEVMEDQEQEHNNSQILVAQLQFHPLNSDRSLDAT